MAPTRASIGTSRVGSTSLTVATLRGLGMPWDEIDAILETDDPRLVRRYLQLHGERLGERLAEQRATLLSLEQGCSSTVRSAVVVRPVSIGQSRDLEENIAEI